MPSRRPGSGNSALRSALVLAALLVVALTVLLVLRSQDKGPDFTLGGPLFTTTAAEVEGLLVTRGPVTYRLDRQPEGYWSLSGGLTDFLEPKAVDNFLATLTSATGGRLLPGSQPEDRRYGFNGPGALRVTLFGPEGLQEKLAVGTSNPVTGYFYGSGAGRPACFPVTQGLQAVLNAVPASLQLPTLLPEFPRQAIRQVELWRGETLVLLQKNWGRWWLARTPDNPMDPGQKFRAYEAYYRNRRASFDGHDWLLAGDPAVGLLVYETSRVKIKESVPAGDAARLSQYLQQNTPWRRVVLHGKGINPDPTDPIYPDRLELQFHQPLDAESYPATRRENLFLVEKEAFNTLSEPVSSLLNLSALEFLPSRADSLVLYREGQVLLRAHREQRQALPGERRKERPVDFWETDFPAPEPGTRDRESHHRLSRNLLVNLERSEIRTVLPPTADGKVLREGEKVRLEFAFAQGEARPGFPVGQVVVEVGFLDPSRLPAGSPRLVTLPDEEAPVGLWRPDTGQLLQVSGTVLTTARAWALLNP